VAISLLYETMGLLRCARNDLRLCQVIYGVYYIYEWVYPFYQGDLSIPLGYLWHSLLFELIFLQIIDHSPEYLLLYFASCEIGIPVRMDISARKGFRHNFSLSTGVRDLGPSLYGQMQDEWVRAKNNRKKNHKMIISLFIILSPPCSNFQS